MLTLSNGMISWAELYVSSSLAAVLVVLSPFALVGISRWLGDAIPGSTWLGLILSFVGVVVLLSKGLGPESGILLPDAPSHSTAMAMLAVGLILLSAGLWSVGSIVAARRPSHTPLRMRVACQMLAGGAGQLVIAAARGEWRDVHGVTASSIGALAYLIVVGSLIGYGCYIYVLGHFSPDAISVTTYVNTIVAVTVGWLIGDEELSWRMAAGGVLVLAGIVVVNWGLRRTRGMPATGATNPAAGLRVTTIVQKPVTSDE